MAEGNPKIRKSPEKGDLCMDAAQKPLSAALKARIERNRQKALLLKQSRLVEKGAKENEGAAAAGNTHKLIDSGGGFFIEEDGSEGPKNKQTKVEEPAPALPGDEIVCIDCSSQFRESYLLTAFDYACCDKCKNMDEKHKLITKSEAKDKYQLTDVDLEKRDPILKYYSRKNPHNPRWGEMKLYLELQIEEKALDIYGSFDEIEAKRNSKSVKKEVARRKKYQKQMNNLRKEVRSSLYTKDLGGHEHEFDPESCKDEENDIWSKVCKSCGHELTYEKM